MWLILERAENEPKQADPKKLSDEFLSVLLLAIPFSAGFKGKTQANNIVKHSVFFCILMEISTRKDIETTQNYLMEIRNKVISPYFNLEMSKLCQSKVIERN